MRVYPFIDSPGTKYGLNDGKWHTLTMSYANWRMELSVDDCDIGLALRQPQLYEHPCAASLSLRGKDR